jgi:ATP-dependent Clp protease ATP-binding subunit ClpC
MPEDKDLKRLIRARMAKTGESYTAARRELLRSREVGAPAEGLESHTEQPFSRFSEQAKLVLTIAQQEAERDRRGYIGTEHLLLGMLWMREGLAGRVLTTFNVTPEVVRARIDALLGPKKEIPFQQTLPTSRVKKAIDLAFHEAQGMGDQHVGTEHLLLGIVGEGEGIACRVLAEVGVDIERVRGALTVLRAAPGGNLAEHRRVATGDWNPYQVPMGAARTLGEEVRTMSELSLIIDAAIREARADGARVVRNEHLLLALLQGRGTIASRVLEEADLRVDEVRTRVQKLARS